jgi:hypothetical protein
MGNPDVKFMKKPIYPSKLVETVNKILIHVRLPARLVRIRATLILISTVLLSENNIFSQICFRGSKLFNVNSLYRLFDRVG